MDLLPAIALLLLSVLVSVFAVVVLGKRHGWASFSSLSITAFAVVYPLSGLCHIIGASNYYRGFFDSLAIHSNWATSELNLYASLLVLLCNALLVMGCITSFPSVSIPRPFSYSRVTDKKLLLVSGFFFLAIGAAAFSKLIGSISFDGIDRSRVLSGGVARYGFLSAWFCWGITLLYIWTLHRLKSNFLAAIIFIALSAAIAGNLFWTGGRSIIVVFLSPALLYLVQHRPKAFRVGAPLIVAFVTFYIILLTYLRTEGYDRSGLNLYEAIDWQVGRYSMVAYALDYVERNGLIFGRTLLFSAGSIFLSPLYFASEALRLDATNSITHIIGRDILSSSDAQYIVPGIVPEMYMNFGLIGACLFSLLLGTLVRGIDRVRRNTAHDDVYRGLLVNYTGALVCLNLVNSTFFALLNYLFFYGAPLIALFVVSRFRFRNR